jgi:hypothetical protein
MDDEEFLTEEQVYEIANQKFVFDYYVYFDKDSGNILSLSNEPQPYENFVQVEFEEIQRFFKGEDSFINFKVAFDKDGSIKFVHKNEGDLIFKNNIIEHVRLNNNENILTIEWSKLGWTFSIGEQFLQHPKAKSLNAKLLFYVTKEDNINVLIRVIEMQLRNLIGNGSVLIPFKTDEEKDIENISIFTLPFFESYGMRINYD